MKIIVTIIVLLFALILGTIFVMSDKEVPVENGNTDFSVIGLPVDTPKPKFTDLLIDTPNPLQQSVLDNVYLDEYYLYPCDVNGIESTALVLVAQYKANGTGLNTFEQAQGAVKSFEDDLYADWGHIIYKEAFNKNLNIVNFVDEKVTDEEVLTETYRVGNLSDGKTKIYYGWILNYLTTASSKECLLETLKSIYPIH